jgi:prepilin-type processing-associated H-X9-DG protein
MQYTQDYDERLPGRVMSGLEAYSWRRVIYPYVKSTQLFSCPSNTANTTIAGDSTDGQLTTAGLPLTSPRFTMSYLVNSVGNNIGGTNPMEYGQGSALASLTDVARTVLVTEGDQSWNATEAPMQNAAVDFAASMYTGHLGTVNFLFADGHVKAMKPTATGTPTNMWNIEETNDAFPALMERLNAWQNRVNK